MQNEKLPFWQMFWFNVVLSFLGVLVTFVQYIQKFFEPLRDLSGKYTILQSAMAGAERVFALLDAPGNAGMNLTESCAMTPAAAVSGFYIAHPGAGYFAIPKIGRDQLEDCAARKGMDLKDAERWLAPLL